MSNENKLGQENAFPYASGAVFKAGITKRLFLAGMALQGLLSNCDLSSGSITNYEIYVEKAVKLADELLKQEAL